MNINIHMWVLCGHKFLTHLGKYQGVQLLDYMAVYLVLWETTTLSSKVVVPFCIPTSSEREFLWLRTLTSIWCFGVLDFHRSNGHVVVSRCFNLHFHDDIWCGASLRMLDYSGCSVVPVSFVEETVFALLYCLCQRSVPFTLKSFICLLKNSIWNFYRN